MGTRNNQPTHTVELGAVVKKIDENDIPKSANFEEAVEATGYGKFHYLLYLAVIPASWASGFDTSTTSMIAPSAECDLNLTLFQKGVLNAIVYAGMVSSALMWGFIADAFGRKPIVFYGYLVDGILNVFSGLSQNFYVLASFKFICGFIVSGPYASVMTYCAEFHCTKDRPRITMFVGFLITAGSIIGAVLALLIIPQEWWSFTFGQFEIHSWQIYLAICGLPVLCGTACLGFFPESPKFLMSQGRNEEALNVFKKYTRLTQDNPKRLIRTNTIRLWQPQLFAIIGQSTTENDDSESDFSFCNIIDQSTFTRVNESITDSISNSSTVVTCVKKTVDNSVYMNTIIISASSLFFTFLAGVLVNLVKNKHLLLVCYIVAVCSVLALKWSKSVLLTLILISLFVGCLSASVNLVISVVVNLFPTTMRTMAVSLTMMAGRIGSLIGNILFPVFLEYGCTVAILSLAALVSVSFVLTAFVPKPKESVT